MDSPKRDKQELLRKIPQVGELLEIIDAEARSGNVPRVIAADSVRKVLEEARSAILGDSGPCPSAIDLSPESLAERAFDEMERAAAMSIRNVINATGVVLHTNIGRSPLCESAIEAVIDVSKGYCNLEYRLEDGARGSRQEHLEGLICRLTDAGGAMVVNNNAAAATLVLTALAHGREVVISRGELVEIGDSFRLPDIMQQSGARLVEVGTTNRTRIEDYVNAIGPDTALLMKIHQSNFRIAGYGGQVGLEKLVDLGRQHFIPVVEDLGSGSLVDLDSIGLHGEHTAMESLAEGADIVTFSGDKILGGPQAGLIVGSSEYVDSIRKHPLARAIRIDKMTIAALEATLRVYLDPEKPWEKLPVLRMLSEPKESVKKRVSRLKRKLDRSRPDGLEYRVVEDTSRAGGGSLPTAEIPTYCLSLEHPGLSAALVEERLRNSEPPVVSRVKDQKVLLDMRTVREEEIEMLADIIVGVI